MTDESLTPNMHEVLFWLDDGQWHDPAGLYQKLGRAHDVGSTLSAMDKRCLIELRRVQRGKYDWPEWRKLGNAADCAED